MIYTQGVGPGRKPWHGWEMGNCLQQRIQCVAIAPGKPMWDHGLIAKKPVLQTGQAKETLKVLATFFAKAWLQGSGTSPPKQNDQARCHARFGFHKTGSVIRVKYTGNPFGFVVYK